MATEGKSVMLCTSETPGHCGRNLIIPDLTTEVPWSLWEESDHALT